MKPLGLDEDGLVLLLFFSLEPHLKTAWGLPPLYNDSVPFKISLLDEATVGGVDCVIHFVSSSGRGLSLYSNWFKIEDLEAFNNLQQIKNHLSRGQNL